MASIHSIRDIVHSNFINASSEFETSPGADNWNELVRAMFAHQQAFHMKPTDTKKIEAGLTAGEFLVRSYESYDQEMSAEIQRIEAINKKAKRA